MSDTNRMDIVIGADGSSAAAVLGDIETRLTALEAAFHRVPPAAEGVGAAMEEINGHARTLVMGLNAAGLEADAMAVKFEALTAIVKAAESSFGPLLLIGAGIAAMGAAFSVFSGGVKLAADFESQMVSLGTAVRLSGGDWDKTSEQVKKYLEVQEQATGYDQNEVLTALNKLVVAGSSVRDAEYEVAVAEDAARATHKDLLEVVQTLISAEGARATGLERLDPRLKTLIEQHASLFRIMQQLESDMSGQAAAALDTYTGKWDKLWADMDAFKRDIGDWLVPWLDKVVDRFDMWARSMTAVGEALGHGDWGKAFWASQGVGLPDSHTAQQQRQAQINAQHGLDTNPNVGAGGAGGSGYDPSLIDISRDSTNYADPTKQTAATSMMKAFADVEGELEAKMKSASSSAEEQADKLQLLTQKMNDAKAEANALVSMVAESESAWKNQAAAVEQAHTSLNAAQAAENAYEQSLKGTKHETDAQKDEQHQLAAAVKNANDAYEAARQKLGELGQSYKALFDLQEQVHKSVVSTSADYLAAANAEAKADADYYQKAALQQAEFMATFEKTNAQKVRAYDQLIAHLSTDDVNYNEEVRDLTTKRTEAWQAALDDQAKAYKKWVDDATKETESFIDDVVLKHESMRDELKNIFDQIEKNYVDMLAKMLIGGQNGSGLGPLAFLFGSAPTTSGFGGAAGGNSRTGSSPSNAIYVIPTDADANFLSKTTGNIGGVSPTSITAGMNSQSSSVAAAAGGGGGGGLSGISAILGAFGAVAGGAGAGEGLATAVTGKSADTTNGAIGAAIGVAGAVGAASLITGASLGTTIAGLASGPPGWALLGISALAGAFGGGLIGPQYNATTNPDMYNSPSSAFGNYDQFIANYGGGAGMVGGQQVTPDNQYYTANGGVSMQQQIENEITTAQMSSLTQAQQQLLQQFIALNGGTTNPNGLSISYEHQGNFGLASGQTTSVTNLQNLVSQFQQIFGSTTAGSPIYTVGRSYPDFNLGTLNNTGLSTPPTGGTSTTVGNVTVVMQNPTIVGPGGLQTVAVQIGQAIQRAGNGLVPGSPNTYGGTAPSLQRLNAGLG